MPDVGSARGPAGRGRSVCVIGAGIGGLVAAKVLRGRGWDVTVMEKNGDLVRLPAGVPHGYCNLSDAPTRAMFWVAPGRRLRELFDALHNMADPERVVREAAQREVRFLKPEEYAFDPLVTGEAGQP